MHMYMYMYMYMYIYMSLPAGSGRSNAGAAQQYRAHGDDRRAWHKLKRYASVGRSLLFL